MTTSRSAARTSSAGRARAGAAFRQKNAPRLPRRPRPRRRGSRAGRAPRPLAGSPASRSSAFAPGATTISFSPSVVDEDQRDAGRSVDALRARGRRRASRSPAERLVRRSRPRRPRRPTAPAAPSRAAATAWFAPLPPGTPLEGRRPVSVSPGRGSRSQRATRSRLIEPTTAIAAQAASARRSSSGAAEQVLAQVEEAGPERRAVGRRTDPRRVVEALRARARARRARGRPARRGPASSARPRGRAPASQSISSRRARARRTRSVPPPAPARARAGSARAAARGRRAPSRRARPLAAARPAAARACEGSASPRRPALQQPAERERGDLAGRELARSAGRPSPPRLRSRASTSAQPGSARSVLSGEPHQSVVERSEDDRPDISSQTGGVACSYLDHDGQDHRPAAGAVVDQLPERRRAGAPAGA